MSVKRAGQFLERKPVGNVTIMGVSGDVSGVTMNTKPTEFRHDPRSEVLVVTGLEDVTAEGAWAQGWTLAWM
jgi:alpha-glucosidase